MKTCMAIFLAGVLWSSLLTAQEKNLLPAGFRGEAIAQVNELEKKFMDLAGAVPQEKYAWRPGDGVRSVGEVFAHVGEGNYLLLGFMGVKPDKEIAKDIEKETDKAKIIDFMKESFAFVRRTVTNTADSDLDKKVKFFGNSETTVRNVIFSMVNHQHEHLGQAIAYARMNGVTPPWSMPKDNKDKEKDKKKY